MPYIAQQNNSFNLTVDLDRPFVFTKNSIESFKISSVCSLLIFKIKDYVNCPEGRKEEQFSSLKLNKTKTVAFDSQTTTVTRRKNMSNFNHYDYVK